jgi:hypothetical protein
MSWGGLTSQVAADEELYLNGNWVFKKRKIAVSYHDSNPLTCWQDSKHSFHFASLAHDLVIAATRISTARLSYSIHLCEDSYCLMLCAATGSKDDKPSFVSLLLFADRSGESSVTRVRAHPTQLCDGRLMWWHLAHGRTSHISAVPVIIVILIRCCTQSPAPGSRAFLPTARHPQVAPEWPACLVTLC